MYMFMGLVARSVNGMVASSSPVGGSGTLQLNSKVDYNVDCIDKLKLCNALISFLLNLFIFTLSLYSVSTYFSYA